MTLSKIIELTDEQYHIVEHAAERQGKTADELIANLIDGLRDPLTEPRYFELEDWFRHLEGGEIEEEQPSTEGRADADPR
jgi:hypothetical protein